MFVTSLAASERRLVVVGRFGVVIVAMVTAAAALSRAADDAQQQYRARHEHRRKKHLQRRSVVTWPAEYLWFKTHNGQWTIADFISTQARMSTFLPVCVTRSFNWQYRRYVEMAYSRKKHYIRQGLGKAGQRVSWPHKNLEMRSEIAYGVYGNQRIVMLHDKTQTPIEK